MLPRAFVRYQTDPVGFRMRLCGGSVAYVEESPPWPALADAPSGDQKVAVAAGFTHILWPTEVVTGKVVVLDLE